MKRYIACKTSELPVGGRLSVELDGQSVGVFNVNGRFFALHNRCPHVGGPLCRGPLSGTALPTDRYDFVYGREGYILRCGWHGWEFDIETGQAIFDPKVKARTFPVAVEDDEVVVHL